MTIRARSIPVGLVAAALLLTGCASDTDPTPVGPTPEASSTLTPVPTPEEEKIVHVDGNVPLVEWHSSDYNMSIKVYPLGTLTTDQGCGCTLSGEDEEAYPHGSEVRVFRILLSTTLDEVDYRGMTMKAEFDGTKSYAFEYNERDARNIASDAGFGFWTGDKDEHGKTADPKNDYWLAQTVPDRSLAVAYYIPEDATSLTLTFVGGPTYEDYNYHVQVQVPIYPDDEDGR